MAAPGLGPFVENDQGQTACRGPLEPAEDRSATSVCDRFTLSTERNRNDIYSYSQVFNPADSASGLGGAQDWQTEPLGARAGAAAGARQPRRGGGGAADGGSALARFVTLSPSPLPQRGGVRSSGTWCATRSPHTARSQPRGRRRSGRLVCISFPLPVLPSHSYHPDLLSLFKTF